MRDMQLGAASGSDDGSLTDGARPQPGGTAEAAEETDGSALPWVPPRLSEALLRRILRTLLANWEVATPASAATAWLCAVCPYAAVLCGQLLQARMHVRTILCTVPSRMTGMAVWHLTSLHRQVSGLHQTPCC